MFPVVRKNDVKFGAVIRVPKLCDAGFNDALLGATELGFGFEMMIK